MLSKCTLLEYPLLTGMDPLVVHRPSVGKEKALTNQRPFCHSVWSDRGCAGKASANQRLSRHWVRRVLSSAIGDPYKLRCTSTSGSVLEYLLYRTLRTGAVGGAPTAKMLKFTGQEASSVATYYSKVAFVFFLV